MQPSVRDSKVILVAEVERTRPDQARWLGVRPEDRCDGVVEIGVAESQGRQWRELAAVE